MLLSVRDVTLRFGGIVALDGVSFDVERGIVSGLIGPNGAGKTTVFNVITRLYTPDAGEVVSAAKAWIGLQATGLIQDCVQLHGGIGVTWEHDLHIYLRRATVNRATHGTPEEHGERVAASKLGASA